MSETAEQSIHSLAEQLAGKFIVFDGPDGTGKSTQLEMLRKALADAGADVDIVIDPGGTATGQKIRDILLGKDTDALSPACEALLFMASRAQLVFEKVRPALKAGKVVLGDRFITATLAYQGASGVAAEDILDLSRHAVGETFPDLTILLDIDAAEGITRAGAIRDQRHQAVTPGQMSLFGDRMESRALDYHQAVRNMFEQIGKTIPYPRPVAHVSAAGTREEVHQRILEAISKGMSDA